MIIGFFVILLGGRQGLVADVGDSLVGERITFAYGLLGLFLALPVLLAAARHRHLCRSAPKPMNLQLEEAARSLGASRLAWRATCSCRRAAPTTLACGAILFATSMGAFGTAFTLASKFEVIPITIYNEFTNYANFALAASLSIALGLVTWLVLFVGAPLRREARSHAEAS